jgi:MFS family permease
MLFWSVASWGVLMFCMGFTTSYSGMLVLRVLLGLAEGPLFALAYTIVKQTYTDRQQARINMFYWEHLLDAFLVSNHRSGSDCIPHFLSWQH